MLPRVTMQIRLPLLARAMAAVWRRLPFPIQRAVVALKETHYTVAVVAVILDEQDRVLLLAHPFRGRLWGIPGGFVGRHEQPEDALRREMYEEVGLTLASVRLSHARCLASEARIEMVFLCRTAGTPVPDGFEISAARWVCPAELSAHLQPDDREVVFTALGRGARPEIPAQPDVDDGSRRPSTSAS